MILLLWLHEKVQYVQIRIFIEMKVPCNGGEFLGISKLDKGKENVEKSGAYLLPKLHEKQVEDFSVLFTLEK